LSRLFARVKYEIRKKGDIFIGPKLALFLCKLNFKYPKFKPFLFSFEIIKGPEKYLAKEIKFKFLNQEKILKTPIKWNSKEWERLWQFNLHYFDWARLTLEESIKNGKWIENSSIIEPLIDAWIESNPPGIGDGWHSYTISLRCRNWIWLYNFCPSLITEKRSESLWNQICWLSSHPEFCHGGNHWLENLITLSIGSIHFDGIQAKKIENDSLNKLEKELHKQILSDGGHEERSAGYHLLILDRLVELAIIIEKKYKECPFWLTNTIFKMNSWSKKVRMEDNNVPVFNDSAIHSYPNVLEIIDFAENFLLNKVQNSKTFRNLLTNSIYSKNKKNNSFLLKNNLKKDFPIHKEITFLKETGWTIIRPGNNCELVFKCGVPCPKHLGAHAHSDQLSFELWLKGSPIISETGTSTYKLGKLREFERSSASHNSIQLGFRKDNHEEWIEPVDIWSNFRVGRKTEPLERINGKTNNWSWVSGSHNGYKRYKANHKRWLGLTFDDQNLPIVVILDFITGSGNIVGKSWLHFGPDFSNFQKLHNFKINSWFSNRFINQKIKKGYIAKGFGSRISRFVNQRNFLCLNSQEVLVTVLTRSQNSYRCKIDNNKTGEITFQRFGRIKWSINNEVSIFKTK